MFSWTLTSTESSSSHQPPPLFKRLATCGSTAAINLNVINTGGSFKVRPTPPKTGGDLIREGAPESLAVRQTKGIINTCRIYRRGGWAGGGREGRPPFTKQFAALMMPE